MFICWSNIQYAVVNEPIPKVIPQAPVVQTLYSAIRQAPVGQTLDSAIHRRNHFRGDKASITEINCAIRWIVIYPEDSANQRLNNWG